MKCGLLSLALLGAPASGCWLRNSFDGRRTEVEGRNWAQDQQVLMDSLLAADEMDSLVTADAARTARAKRIAGKRALSKACSDNVHFSECSQDKGSAIRLERCLKIRSGNKLSASCQTGLQSWKQLLADTAPDARNSKLHKLHRSGSKKAAKKAVRVQGGKDLVARAEQDIDRELPGIMWLMDDRDPDSIDVEIELALAAPHPHHHHPHNPHHPHAEVAAGGHIRHPPHDHFHSRAPAGFLVDEDDEILLPREEKRPSMFSVLADWIFGDSSDSWESSSSSDDLFDSTSSSISTTSAGIGASDAAFFPAGYGLPLEANGIIFEAPPRAQPWNDLRAKRGSTKKPFLRGGNHFRNGPESFGELEAFFADVDLNEEQDWDVPVSEEYPLTEKGFYATEDADIEGMEDDLVFLAGSEEEPGFLNEGLVDVDDFMIRSSRANRVGGHVLEPEWANVREEDLQMFAGGARVHPKHHHRGDHIRFRNPLPEDFKNQRAWLSDSFDVDGDGPDLVEAILAFFFFIGAMTLMLLPFFLLGRALKRMVRNGGGGGSDDADAPDGYYALPEDAASAAAAARMAAAEEDDSIVVTGTPVNPPPSVHL